MAEAGEEARLAFRGHAAQEAGAAARADTDKGGSAGGKEKGRTWDGAAISERGADMELRRPLTFLFFRVKGHEEVYNQCPG
jgi:hypothetical protein